MQRGFRNVRPWTRGVDLARFHPQPAPPQDVPRPLFLYVGRLAVEKNLEGFLSLDLPGTKVVVGDGPQRDALARAYPDAQFLGNGMARPWPRSTPVPTYSCFPR